MVAIALVDELRGPDRRGPARDATDPAGPSTRTKMDRLPPAALLPNLVVLPPEELGLAGRGVRRVLRFATVLANQGVGPVQVRPARDPACPTGQRYVEQHVALDSDADRRYDRRLDRATLPLPGGCMLFHPRHEHWHFDSTAGYALTAVGDTTPIVTRDKVSFCLRDSEPLRQAGARHRRSYEECARDRRQGISVGWADRYDATLAGQRLPLPPGLADGVYCFRLEVDPFGLLLETDESDNTSSAAIRLTGREVRSASSLTC